MSTRQLRIAGAQIGVINDNIDMNLAAINRAMDFAIDEKADILLTPEGSLSGYRNDFNQIEVQEALESIVSRASTNGLGLALGTCFYEEDNLCYNQLRFYNTDGEYLGFHSKTLTCGTPTDPPIGEIEYYAVKPLRTFVFKGIAIGGLICNDLWANPEWTPNPDVHLSQQLSSMGAEIIFHAVNGGRDASEFTQVAVKNYHESNLRLRARAGKVWIATVDNSYPEDIPCSSPSGVLSPEGNWIEKLPPQGEHYFVQTIEI